MSIDWKLNPEGPRDCLIIDDDPSVVDTLTMFCENLAIFRNIVVAEDGQMASVKIRNQKFALILIDLNMPKKDGLKLVADFSTASNKNDIQNAVVISGEIDKAKLQEAISHGIRNFVTKPFDETTFREKIKPALQLMSPE